MSKFAALDAMIVARIARAPCTFTELQEPEINATAERFLVADRYDVLGPTWRVLDRRLQALRKADRIAFRKGQWWIKGREQYA